MVFSVTFVPRCYKQNSFNSESAVGQLPTGKNVSKEAENIFGIRPQATAGKDTAD
jgi:hypothetical protein